MVVEDSVATVASVAAVASAAAAVPPSVVAVASGVAVPAAVASPAYDAMQGRVSGLHFLNEFIYYMNSYCMNSYI